MKKRVQHQAVPPGVEAAVTAAVLDGQSPTAVARQWGVSRSLVNTVAVTVQGLDPAVVAEIRRGLPALLTVLAGAHAAKALSVIDDDPKQAVNSTFGAKLAVEAGRGAEPGAAAPGAHMLTFINQLNVGPQAPAPVVIEAETISPPDDWNLPTAEADDAGSE